MEEPDNADARAPVGRDDPTVEHASSEDGVERTDPTRVAASARPIDADRAQAIVGDRYRVAGPPVSGGMGSVFAAHDRTLERKVAIKLMRESDPSRSILDRGSLLAEARAMAGLNHPHICRVHEISLDGAVPFIVMEWIDGVDLVAAWSDGALQWRLSLFVKVLQAIAVAHRAGVVHRDLKPANILVTNRGDPMIVDFGLARSIDQVQAGVALSNAQLALEAGASCMAAISFRRGTASSTFTPFAVVALVTFGWRCGPRRGSWRRRTTRTFAGGTPGRRSGCAASGRRSWGSAFGSTGERKRSRASWVGIGCAGTTRGRFSR